MLEEFKHFLSSSTIHGLSHIPASRGLWRLFWICSVMAGFSVSSILIWMSFSGWRESPITTSITIKPISELRFPNITVCPPKDTATDLNLYLEIAESLSISNETRDQLLQFFYQNALEIGFDEVFRNWTRYIESDGMRRWYLGLTKLDIPLYHAGYHKMYYRYMTYAPSGEFTTPYYGQPWNASNFDTELYYQCDMRVPWTDEDTDWTESNISIVLDVEIDILTELTSGYDEVVSSHWVFHKDDTKVQKVHKVGGAQNNFGIALKRKISDEEKVAITRETMPGMKVKWRYNGTAGTENNYKLENKNFIRLVDIVHISESDEEVWKAVKEAKKMYIENISPLCRNDIIRDTIVSERLDLVEERLGLATPVEHLESVSNATLLTATEMFVHLVHCWDSKRVKSWMDLYPKLISEHSAKAIIMTLSRIANKVTEHDNKFEFIMAKRMLERVWEVLDLPPLPSNLNHEYEVMEDKINHPVHLIDAEGQLSPSSLIPFCDFGGNVSWIGKKIEEFSLPVCNSFRKTLLKGQLCYELDVTRVSEQKFTSDQLKMGLTLLIDYNEDRMIRDNKNTTQRINNNLEENLVRNIVDFEEFHKAYIHIDTITPIELYGGGHYGLGNVKEIQVTNSYLNMDKSITGCQNIEPIEKCNNRKYLDGLRSCNCVPPNLRTVVGKVNHSMIYLYNDKGRLCDGLDQVCVDKIRVEYEECLPMCEGLSITNFDKDTTRNYRELDEKLLNLMNQYNRYKNLFENPVDFPANLKDFRYQNDLQVVRIYFDTPTFDRITKDERAKFEDMLSTIGGTMGLLTGFSIISGVEIVYFFVKITIALFYRGNHG